MDRTKSYFEDIFGSIRFGWWVFGLLALDALSFHVHFLGLLQAPVFIALLVIAAIIALRNLHAGVLILLAELFVGSKGYLYAIEIGGFNLSIRLALFLIIIAATAIWILRDKRIAFFEWSLWKPYTAAISAIALAVVVGVVRGNELSTIFFDTNGYLYFGLVFAVVQAVKSRQHVTQLIAVMLAATVALSIKTFFLLFLFSHIELMPFTVLGVYEWVRQTGVGEVTRFPNGFARVFIQSQIYMLMAFFFIAPWFAFADKLKVRKGPRVIRLAYCIFTISTAVIILNYSRSFWAASIATLAILTLWMLAFERMPFTRLFRLAVGLLGTVALAYVLILGVINVPLPGFTPIGDLFSQRTSNLSGEAAAATRWNLLTPLADAAFQNPLLGSGLGSTITYQSQDPRVLETHPDGWYTTYAFEWGYLDLLFKFGFIGLGALAYLIVTIMRTFYGRMKQAGWQHIESVGALASLLALLGTHFFTPYLNHPLGIGWILVLSVMAAVPTRKK